MEVSFHKDDIMLTESEIRAIRFYIGDVSGNDPFWSDPKAYVVLNSLFFPDIETEIARTAEGKYLNPAIIEDCDRLVEFLYHLLSAFTKCKNDKKLTTYRVERYRDYQLIKSRGETVSFTSTSTYGFLDAYRDRNGIALMRFDIPEKTPCIEMRSVLEKYSKHDEAEVLLAPRTNLKIKEKALEENMINITDASGAPPIVYSEINVCQLSIDTNRIAIPDKSGSEAGKRVYTALNNGKKPDNADVEQYCTWKKQLTENLINIEKKTEL